ncbi:hypothetical protein HY572_03985 [Candidatus Micrarchaeota archaeon]|nr:hypothetical protein [Candidatus Micrarchaeota archaeon]
MDFLVSVLILTVALGLFIHAAEFPAALFSGPEPALAALSTAILSSQPNLGQGTLNAAALSGPGFCVRISNSSHTWFDGCADFSCPNPRAVDRYANCDGALCTVSVRGCP